MKETVETHKYTCDACGKVVLVENSDEVIGIAGDAYETTATGGGGAEWFACTRKCIAKAITAALDRF